jgi:hypothetical protein
MLLVSNKKILILLGSFFTSYVTFGLSIEMTLFESNVLLGTLDVQLTNKLKFKKIINNLLR